MSKRPAATAAVDARELRNLLDGVAKECANIYVLSKIKNTKSAAAVLTGPPELQAAAVVELTRRFGAVRKSIKRPFDADGSPSLQLLNAHNTKIFPACQSILLYALLRRTQPLAADDWARIVTEVGRFEILFSHSNMFATPLVSAFEAFANGNALDARTRDGLARIAAAFMSGGQSDDVKLARRLNSLLPKAPVAKSKSAAGKAPRSTLPTDCSSYDRLATLYRPPTDGRSFPCFDAPASDKLLTLANAALAVSRHGSRNKYSASAKAVAGIGSLPPRHKADLARLLFAAVAVLSQNPMRWLMDNGPSDRYMDACEASFNTLHALLQQSNVTLSLDDLPDIARSAAHTKSFEYWYWVGAELAAVIAKSLAGANLADVQQAALLTIRERAARDNFPGNRDAVTAIDEAFNLAPTTISLQPGDRFADETLAFLSSHKKQKDKDAWAALLNHAAQSPGPKPAPKWSARADELLNSVGRDSFPTFAKRVLPLFGKPRESHGLAPGVGRDPTIPAEPNADVLKGLVWLCARVDAPQMASLLGDVGMACFKMLPGHGARCVKAGNATVYALSQLTGLHPVSQLSRLRELVKFGSARNILDKALATAARNSGCTPDELKEISLPTFDLDATGRLCEPLSDNVSAEIAITSTTRCELRFLQNDKPLKSAPAAVKRAHGEDIKRLKQSAAGLQKMLPAQRDRLERLLMSGRSWPIEQWRERYLDHPLVAHLTRRLVWQFDSSRASILAIPDDGSVLTADGKSYKPAADAMVRLWHPIASSQAAVLAWRTFLERREIVQPLKQAHREIYLLTDAERRTSTYSNRFAAHIIRVQQFSRLAQDRTWHAGTVGMFDPTDNANPSLKLPDHNLRAEFWLTGIGEETTPAGIHLYAQTDQVRFYPLDSAEPLPLDRVPPVLFSEIMRDVDLFVAVSSVGNDPTWRDSGPQDQHDYWGRYAFGELGISAQTRRDLLSRLLPKLKIAERCRLTDRFLTVQGDFRTYKIHLGSSNILMSPNDQYLCIVPDRRKPEDNTEVFLPFEGDATLAVILSKAFMLADDGSIKDPTITRQIHAK